MKNFPSILLCDFYKTVHAEQYDPKITQLVAYYVPRMSRIPEITKIPVIGIQSFVQEYLIDDFNNNFFNVDLKEIIKQYSDVILETLGENRLHLDKIIDLHNLGYLPIKMSWVLEGMQVPIGCPAIQITNTHPKFAWVVNAIESLMSAELWYQSCTAIAGRLYREIVDDAYFKTSDHPENAKHAICEFGFRGMPSLQAAQKAAMGFLLSFDKTSTIPAIEYIHKYYGDDRKSIGSGMASTEHSVMCSSFAIDKNEESLIKRLLIDVYPTGNFAMVCDSYNYWNVVDNILPSLKDLILSRNGTLFVRGDSGDPVKIITETVEHLWNHFGGTINSKGYKVLDSHIRAIYGDSITQRRAKQIYDILESKGFAADNVTLGAGSFSMLCLETEDKDGNIILNPFTRDTFGVAVKTTVAKYSIFKETSIGDTYIVTPEVPVFKDPVTDTGHFKKSHKGWIRVYEEQAFCLNYKDECTEKEAQSINIFKYPKFENGKLLEHSTFEEIRYNFWNGKKF